MKLEAIQPIVSENSIEINETGISYLNTLKIAEESKSFSIDEARDFTQKTLSFLQELPGAFFENVSDIYSKIDHEIVVRRESPIAIIESLVYEEPLSIKFQDGGTPYNNSVLWQVSQGKEGLQNAFMEGFSSALGICMVAGYEKNNLKVEHLESSPDNNITKYTSDGKIMSRNHVVATEGTVNVEDIDFLVVRIPYHFMSEDLLRDEEIVGGEHNREGKMQHVFRGVLLKDQTSKNNLH
jgi:hypothetical protein